MKRSQILAWTFLGLLLSLAGSIGIFYDRMPWVGTHFVYTDSELPTRWSLGLQLQQGRALGGGQATLAEVPPPSNQATLKASLLQQGRRAGTEWVQTLRIESVESVQYSWDQKGNKDLLNSQWEAQVGRLGGLLALQIKSEGRSIWSRAEITTPWLLTLWPQFLTRGVEPKDSWTSLVPFRVSARELDKPISARWDCTWTYRGNPPDARVPLATLDVVGQAHSEDQPLEGNLRAEVVYSVIDKMVVAGRGSFQIRMAVSTQATEQSAVSVLECLQGQFLLQRLLAEPDKSPDRSGAPSGR